MVIPAASDINDYPFLVQVRKEYMRGVPSHYSAETNGELSRRHLFRSVGTGYEEILGYAYVVGRCGRFTR